MFTGLVDSIGLIESARPSAAGLELRISCSYEDVAPGESIAVNGVCLTARESGPGWFVAAVMEATRSRTTLARWAGGGGVHVNLERALRAGDRLGGHIVQGHVDAVGRVASVREGDDALLVDVDVGAELDELLIPHGSITIDGVSLTINATPAPQVAQVSLIEYTRRHTTLGALVENDLVNVEGDVIGKYVRRLLTAHIASDLRPPTSDL
ncbi:MAG TPA: riboflavin synthase [Gemmatimonadaceae bacterium]